MYRTVVTIIGAAHYFVESVAGKGNLDTDTKTSADISLNCFFQLFRECTKNQELAQ